MSRIKKQPSFKSKVFSVDIRDQREFYITDDNARICEEWNSFETLQAAINYHDKHLYKENCRSRAQRRFKIVESYIITKGFKLWTDRISMVPRKEKE